MPTFTADELAKLWTVWEEPDRSAAEAASPDERRRLVFERYGLIERGNAAPDESTLPLGYASEDGETFVPNCLACHGGRVAGTVVPGLANNEQDLGGLVGDLLKLRSGGAGPEAGILALFPLNFTRGSTNATMYSILLGSLRDENLDQVFPPKISQPYVHNTIDAPAWWLYSKKDRIYWDGMAPKTTRTLMQFTMAPGLSGEKIRSWEDEFEVIHDYIAGLEAPRYPFAIDEDLAKRGRQAFESTCSECHGTYGDEPTYPNRTVPLALLGTDPVRLDAIRPESKAKYNKSWFANYGDHPVIVDVRGYVAPPLDGVWATAPYLHNGSVPTLWHLLFPEERPDLWRHRGTADYDEQRGGLFVDTFDEVPAGLTEREQRFIYDTSKVSQSNAGHRFPERLTPEERRAVLEYLKTL
ncbi:MAG: cytochrome c [Acidobacteriota bacterium]